MTESTQDLEGAPTESAADLIKTIKNTSALSVFELNIRRIRALLDAASSGIEKSREKVGSLHSKFSNVLASPAKEEGDIQEPNLEDGTIRLQLNEREIELIQQALAHNLSLIGDLHFHLHNVLCVAAWGAFEGYMQAALAELFTANPHLLSSDKTLSVAEVIAAGGALNEYLIAKEIDDVGRKSFNDLQAYIRSKLQVQFSNDYVDRMRDAYFLRNVIAHSAGFLRKEQLSAVPDGVDIQDAELRIGRDYLHDVLACIEEAVLQLDEHLRNKFGRAQQPQQPEALEPP